jgi:hypothetical protein
LSALLSTLVSGHSRTLSLEIGERAGWQSRVRKEVEPSVKALASKLIRCSRSQISFANAKITVQGSTARIRTLDRSHPDPISSFAEVILRDLRDLTEVGRFMLHADPCRTRGDADQRQERSVTASWAFPLVTIEPVTTQEATSTRGDHLNMRKRYS